MRYAPLDQQRAMKKQERSSLRYSPRSRGLRSSVALQAPTPSTEVGGAGHLDRLPKEVRQMIYAYCLDIVEPITVKQCCGPISTRRERASCKKHGDHCTKIGRENGLTLYKEDEGDTKKYGRFSILSVSKSINEEASWVLFTQCTLLIRPNPALEMYLCAKHCTFFRLQSLPDIEIVGLMWVSAARFRKVRFELPWAVMSIEDPMEYILRLYKAIAFLMKAWYVVKEKPTVPPQVNLELNALYKAVLPFNYKHSLLMSNAWIALYQSDVGFAHDEDLESVGEEVVSTLEQLVYLIGRHGGQSVWRIIAQTPPGYTFEERERSDEIEDEYDSGIAGLRWLESCCQANDVEFVAVN